MKNKIDLILDVMEFLLVIVLNTIWLLFFKDGSNLSITISVCLGALIGTKFARLIFE